MNIDLDRPIPNFRFNFIQAYYRKNIAPVIGDKTGEFLELNTKHPVENMEEREKAYILKMLEHISNLAEANPKYDGVVTKLLEDAGSFSITMITLYQQRVKAVRDAINGLTAARDAFTYVASAEDLLDAFRRYPGLI